jgi:hypothetical protein
MGKPPPRVRKAKGKMTADEQFEAARKGKGRVRPPRPTKREIDAHARAEARERKKAERAKKVAAREASKASRAAAKEARKAGRAAKTAAKAEEKLGEYYGWDAPFPASASSHSPPHSFSPSLPPPLSLTQKPVGPTYRSCGISCWG